MSRLILVTGGAGFIGSHLVDALLARGDRVRVLDDFSTGRRENLAHCLADVELLEGDVRDLGLVTHAVAGCDGVLHDAAVASVTQSLANPVRCDSVTHGGTVNVARLARRTGAGGFVLASSCAVYGDTDALPIGEDAPPRPLSPYALAKLLSEGACRSQARDARKGPSAAAESGSAGMKAVCLRYFNVYGPRQDPSSEYSGVIARFMDVAAARGAVWSAGLREARAAAWDTGLPRYVVYGDGRQSRDFVYVGDVVAANLLALDACLEGRVDGDVLNVGTGLQIDVLALVAAIERLPGEADHDRAPFYGDRDASSRIHDDVSSGAGVEAPIEFGAPREGDIRASQADISRARRLLGYEPATRFADGLAATYAWYVEHGAAGVS